MIAKGLVLGLVAVLTAVAPVAGSQGTLHTVNLAALGPPLSDEVLDGVRGGFAQVAFSVFFTTFLTSEPDLSGTLVVNTSGETGGTTNSTATPDPSTFTNSQNGQVRIAAIAGTSFQGASGFFVLTQVPGNNNVVLTSLNIQIAVINVPSPAALPSLSTLFR